jgi:hypothetical protein
MAEISRPWFRNFSGCAEFKQVALQKEQKKLKGSGSADFAFAKKRIRKEGVHHEVSEIFGFARRFDGAADLLAGAGQSWNRHWSRSGLCGRATGL